MNDYSQIIGISAAVLTGTSMVPQLAKVLKEKKAESVSMFMVIVLICGLGMWIWYGVKKNDIPVIATNSFSLLVNILLVYFGIKYNRKKEVT